MSVHISEAIKAVFFDLDDTLVGTIGPKWVQHKLIAKKYYGKDLSDEELRQHWGKPLSELVCLIYGTDDVERAMANIRANRDEFPKDLFPATIPTLRHLKAANILTGIITAIGRSGLEHDLSLHKVPPELIDYTQGEDDTPFHKPDPRVFEPALAWLSERDIRPSEVVYIGDGLHDMKAALGAGFSFLGVETGLVTRQQFLEQGATSIPSIAELRHHQQ